MRVPRFRRRTLILIVVAAAIVYSVAWLVLPYRLSGYRGDGSITDSGFWSYPRYRIRLPKTELKAPRSVVYKLGGLPPAPFTLRLEIVDPKDPSVLRGLNVVVSVRIADNHDRTVGSASGPLKDWVLSEGSGYVAYWHRDCRDVGFHKGMSYTMTITVSEENSDPRVIMVIPTLEGGGNELP